MAAIVRKCLFICAVLIGSLPLWADRAADVLATVNHVAIGLTDNNVPDALEPFSKDCPDYVQLRDSFEGLTSRGDLINEVDVASEEQAGSEAKLVVTWTMTITSRENSSDVESRTQRVTIKLVQQGNKWKIAELKPLSFFDPQPMAKPKGPHR